MAPAPENRLPVNEWEHAPIAGLATVNPNNSWGNYIRVVHVTQFCKIVRSECKNFGQKYVSNLTYQDRGDPVMLQILDYALSTKA